MKKAIDTYKWITPLSSVKRPISDKDKVVRRRKVEPINPLKYPLNPYIKIEESKTPKTPPKISPKLKISALGALTPRSLRAL